MPNNQVITRDPQTRLCGRLIALPTTSTLLQTGADETEAVRRAISIDFPAMPDSLELVRSTDYAVISNVALPDGVHQYKATRPLEIPFQFRLHYNDQQFCPRGALSLLQIAARLHSFVLPVSDSQTRTFVTPAIDQTKVGTPDEGQLEHDAGSPVFNVQRGATSGNLYPPVTCWLHLMWVAEQEPGISCVGYVKEVAVKLNGPWLRGPNNSFNLPTSADLSFTFVHRPSHGNSFGFSKSSVVSEVPAQAQAFAHDVKDGFYNTRALVKYANYRGLE